MAIISIQPFLRPIIISSFLYFFLINNPSGCEAHNILYKGETLNAGDSLSYKNYTLTMQEDCNLVLYDNDSASWSSNTAGKGKDCYLKMQTDGNLVIYEPHHIGAIWASDTAQKQDGNYVLVLQKDGNVVIYGTSRWASGTAKAHVATV